MTREKPYFDKQRKKILLTGATGFIGTQLIKKIQINNDFQVSSIVRSRKTRSVGDVVIKNLDGDTDFSVVLSKVNIVIHMAAIAHQPADETVLQNYICTNVDATLNLATQASMSGVERFVFLSSIGVLGASSHNSFPLTESSLPQPYNYYTQSKFDAEIGLLKIAENTDMEIVIIRPPLVYGQNAPGSFGKLLNLVRHNIPLPFGSIENKRSFIAIDNLVDFISLCADRLHSPKAANQIFVITDDEDVSTTQFLQKIAKAYGKKQWLIPIPVSWMKFMAKLIGKSEMTDRLFGNLQIDCSKAKNLLGWRPVITMDEQLKKMADAEK